MIGVVPLLGLLGTVVGMIDTFNALQSTGADVQSLSAGISKAMITTSSGLCVAIFGTCILPLKPQEPKVNKKTPNNFVPREAPIMKEKTPNKFIAREIKPIDESFIPYTMESFMQLCNSLNHLQSGNVDVNALDTVDALFPTASSRQQQKRNTYKTIN